MSEEDGKVEFMVHGLPVAQGSKKVIQNKGRTFLVESSKEKLVPWRQEIAQLAHNEMMGDSPWSRGVSVRLMFFLPRPKAHFGTGRNEHQLKESAPVAPHVKPDIDKLTRAVLDALSGVVFHDDAQVVFLQATKMYSEDSRYPGAMVEVKKVV